MLNIVHNIKEFDTNNLLIINLLNKITVDDYVKSIVELSIPATQSIVISGSNIKYIFIEISGDSTISMNNVSISTGTNNSLMLTNLSQDITILNNSDTTAILVKYFKYE